MKIQKKLISLIIALSMIICNLVFPIGQIVYANGEEESKTINFSGNNLVVNEDGTVTFDCEVEENEGRITFALYNNQGELIQIEANGNWDEEQQAFIPNGHDAWADLGTTSYEGCYLLLSSEDVDLTNIKFDIAGQLKYVDDNNKLDLSIDAEHISIDSYNIRPLHEKKTIQYFSENLQISNNGRVTLECNLEDNSGIIFVTAYNSDGTVIMPRKSDYEWNEETQEWEEGRRSAFGTLNNITFDGAYLIVESNEVDLTELKFTFTGAYNGEYYETKECFIDENGKVDLTGCEYVYLEDSAYRLVHEKKTIEFYSDTLVFNENGTITMNTEIEGNEGPITLELHNADGSKVNINQGMCWNEELQEEEPDPTRGEARLNTSTYEGAYFVVTSESVDLSDIVFDLVGHRIEVNNEGRVYLPSDVEWLYIEPWCINEKNVKKIVYFYFEDGITANNDGTINVPCTLKNNNGSLNLALYNSDGTKVNIKKTIFWDWETETEYESNQYAQGKLNTTSFEGAYFIVTSEDVNVSNIKFRINGKDVLIDNTGKAILGNEEYIDIEKYSIKNINPDMVPITVNATSTNANIAGIWINDVEFTNENTTNTVNVTHDVEDCEEDHIIIWLEDGKIIKTIRLNGEEGDLTEDNTGWLNFEYPHTDTYTIELICDDDPYYLPSIFWCYEDATMGEEDAIVRNGRVQVVSVALPDGETVYDYDELYPEDTPGIGRHPKHDEAYYVDGEEDGYGELYAKVGSTVTLKLIPDDGYEVSSLDLGNGLQLVPDPEVPNQYSFVMPNRVIFLSGLITEAEEIYNGLVEVKGTWYYYKDGVVDTGYTGLVQYNGSWYYIQQGELKWGVRTLVQYYGTWYYVNNSTLDWNYTGLCEYYGTEYYIQKGTLHWGVNGLTNIGGTWYYLKNSSLQKDYTGLVQYNKSWYYVQNGVLNWGIRTLVQYNGTWYYVNNSTLDWNYTGLCEYYGTEYYIQKGTLHWGVNGLTNINGTWYYLKNSSLQSKYTGLVEYNKTWYYINNGVLDWNYTGLCEYYGTEYYIQKGTLHWGVNGLTNINGTWYYLKNSSLQKNYTGLVQFNKSWYYVQKGVLNWGVKTLVQYNGTWYYVNNSTLDWNFTGLCEYYGTEYYIQKGVLKWGYDGDIVYNGNTYHIKNSMVVK